ncbi:KH domain-containing protein [Nocardia vinacea]|uniref:KH domain-containing protein n=1 Tax=Nocardia vinacea TaxID=96468 RepID=UPI00340B9BC3
MSEAVELVLDLSHLRDAPSTPEEFANLWDELEPALHGRDFRQRPICCFDAPEGEVRLEVVRLPAAVGLIDEDTAFAVVAVREGPRLHYRCKHCRTIGESRYAPFVCSACPSDTNDNRVCDQHVVILDGALTPTCQDHRPRCQQCAEWAVFRCAGRACRYDKAWCVSHRRQHPRDPDISYCPSCFEVTFPHCEYPRCTDIGTVRCEHVTRGFRQCEKRMCTRHAKRWQVFGGERMGLGQCARHSEVVGLTADEVMFRIIAGASGRRRQERLPSLQGFAHTLRKCRHEDLAIDYPRIHRLLGAEGNAVRENRQAATAYDRARPDWDRQLATISGDSAEGARLVERLKALVNSRSGHEVAAAIELAEYKAASTRSGNARPAMLFVKVPQHVRGLFIGSRGEAIRYYSEQLGVRVQIEGGRR